MAKYKLIVSGWEIETSAHSISEQEYEKIVSFKEDNNISTFHEMMDELENLVEGYYRYSGNIFNKTCLLSYENDTYFEVLDENDNEVLSFKLTDIDHDSEKFEEMERETYNADPEYSEHNYIIFASDSSKGVLFGADFESDELPKIEDFDYLDNYIGTPEGDIDYIEDIYFKGEKLEKNYDFADSSGKSSETDIFIK
jgi:hypothetical protein